MEVKQDREKLLCSEEYHVRLESLEWEIRAPQKSAWIKTDKYQALLWEKGGQFLFGRVGW